MTKPSRLVVPALVLLLAACNTTGKSSVPPPKGSDGETVTRSMMERKLLDACVYRQYSVLKDQNRDRMISSCECAASKAIKEVPEPYTLARGGAITGSQDLAVRRGIEACFKS
ncbi:hypothetical protein HDIA_2784 [Hartmannibacter diazotrophicus]|uniref:Lipoprotein n=2 Tax=Hartmannibacter diazotrophicus TaxID=1482074 RepID=A0A2C9D9R1_9HYPH|nr:hypothetical protein HDIA_2784 [Hartmannibacter diazotrophicus]